MLDGIIIRNFMQNCKVESAIQEKRYISSNIKTPLVVAKLRLEDETILSTGMVCMTAGILVGRFARFEYSGFAFSDLIEGLLLDVSLVIARAKDLSAEKSAPPDA